MRRRVACAVGLAAIWIAALAGAEPAAKPNIILILSDDVGLGDIGCCGGPFKTPRIDELASSGIRFPQCYSTPLCGPSRCLLLTGRYPFRTGLISNQSAAALAAHKEIMIPTVMKKAGYVTACVGKWGQMPYGPGQWGFDEWMSCKGSGRYRPEQGIEYERNGDWQKLKEGEYLPDLMHDFIVRFIAKNKDKPFFLYYPIESIHGPILPTPDSRKQEGEKDLYRDNIAYMDKLVGRLVDELGRLGLREKTLVMFAGDNGTAHFGVSDATVNGRAISGMKGKMLEGGSRVPMIANWPGTVPAGKVLNDLVDFSDFFTTVAELGGASLPDGVKLDGHSFAPQLRGETGSPREWVYVELNGRSYVRDARYKLTNARKLFDLQNAPFEEPEVTNPSAQAKLQAVLSTLGPNPAFTPTKKPAGKALRKKDKKRNS